MKINIGGKAYPGWKNLDCYHAADYKHDLRDLLPFPFDGVEEFHCSHVLEHINDKAAQFTLNEVYRTLAPGGSVRISVPDATTSYIAYINNNHAFFDEGEAFIEGPNIGKKFMNMLVSYRGGGGPPVTDEEVALRCSGAENFDTLVQWGLTFQPPPKGLAHRNWFNVNKLAEMLTNSGFTQMEFGGKHPLDKYPKISLRVTARKGRTNA